MKSTPASRVRVAATLLFAILGGHVANAATTHVDKNAVGANNGTTWNDAFLQLQDALAIATFGDQVFVAEGTYRPDQGVGQTPGDRTASFKLANGVGIYGGFLGFESTVAQRAGSFASTILSGDLLADDGTFGNAENSRHVVTSSGVTGAVLDGFLVTAANGNLVDSGGGLQISTSTVTIRHCIIIANEVADDGAGASCTSSTNTAFVECQFIANRSGDVGAGLWSSSSSLTLVNCSFLGNDSGRLGGGLYYFGSNSGVSPITGCVFSGNTAADRGGAVYVSTTGSSPRLVGCTLSGNSANNGSGGIAATTTSTLIGCVLWGNTSPGTTEAAQVGAAVPANFNYNCVQGLTGTLGGVGNIATDPLFVDANGADDIVGNADDDLRLAIGSPCIDAADSGAFPSDAFDLDADGVIAEPVALDIAGEPRLVDDPSVADTGAGGAPVADIGAHEGAGTPAVISYGQGCPGSGGFVPTLTSGGVPTSGQQVILQVANGLGGAQAVLLLGLGQAATPIAGGCLLNVTPVLPAQIFFPLGGSGPGNGAVTLFAVLPTGIAGFTFTLQVFVAEPSAQKPFSNSAGLQLTIQ